MCDINIKSLLKLTLTAKRIVITDINGILKEIHPTKNFANREGFREAVEKYGNRVIKSIEIDYNKTMKVKVY